MKAILEKSFRFAMGVLLGFSIIQSQTKMDIFSEDFTNILPLTSKGISSAYLDVNNISGIFNNNGVFYSDLSTYGPGFEWIKGSNKFAVFGSAIWIGAKYMEDSVRSDIRVAHAFGGSNTSYKPGVIDPVTGLPDDPEKPVYKVYKVQPLDDSPLGNPDLLNWPIEQGAPWIDIDKDGIFNPDIDKVGIRLAGRVIIPDMVLFCVFNNGREIISKFKPLYAEIRLTAWAFKAIPNVHFIRFQIYNRSNKYWDSTYIGLLADPDIGGFEDDYAGCDLGLDKNGKSHQLGYCYNGDDSDEQYGANPPAFGFKLLQGPAVLGNITDTATYFDRKLYGYKNLNMSSFLFYCNLGVGGCVPKYTILPMVPPDYYELLKGKRVYSDWFLKNGKCDPLFELTGDPLADTGCVNSDLISPTDIRYFMNIGPFTVAPGDSQDVIYAALIEQGSDRLNSITKLRNTSSELRYFFDCCFEKIIKTVDVAVDYISSDSVRLKLMVEAKEAKNVFAKLCRNQENFELNLELYDDGVSDDGIANNQIFGAVLNLPQNPVPLDHLYSVKYIDNTQIDYGPLKKITVAGPLSIHKIKVIKENLVPDKNFNVGEDVRCIFSISNESKFRLGKFIIGVMPVTPQFFKNIKYQKCTFPYYIESNSIEFSDTTQFLSFAIKSDIPDLSQARIMFFIADTLENRWVDTFDVFIYKNLFPDTELYTELSKGEAYGAFGVRIIFPQNIKNNTYNIEVKQANADYLINLINSTTSDTLLLNHELPDSLGFNIPVTDGFRLTRGTIETKKGLKRWEYKPSKNLWFTGVKGWKTDLFMGAMKGFIAYPTQNNFISMNSGLPLDSIKYVEIHFNRKIFQKAYRYISGFATYPPSMRKVKHPEFRPFVKDSVGSGWIFQDYEKYRLGIADSGYVVPFTVWQVDIKGNKVRQLDVAIVERNDSLYRWTKTSPVDSIKEFLYHGNVDGRWNPSPVRFINDYEVYGGNGDEWIIIFNSTYSENPKDEYCIKPFDSKFAELPIMYAVLIRRLNPEFDFVDGDVLKILPYRPIREGVAYSFNPVELKEQVIPGYFRLNQNFPNPFNAGTTIQYGLHMPGRVQLDVFNILGQKVKTLIDNRFHNEGLYWVFWDGTADNNLPVASGVYLYRIQIDAINTSFIQTKKMVIIR